MNEFNTIRKTLKGPVYPIMPAFSADQSLDLTATGNYIDFLLDHGAKVLMITAGTSRFNLLEHEEIYALNKLLAEKCKGRATSIVANQMIGSLSSVVSYAKKAEESGADILLVYYPERFYNEDKVYNYYKGLADQSKIALMIHAYPIRNAKGPGTVNYSVDLCKRLASIDQIIGMKEEHGNNMHTYNLVRKVGDKMSFIAAGGGMRLFLSNGLYGTHGFLTGLGNFLPELEQEFYQMMQEGQTQEALEIVEKIEQPYFGVAAGMGWHTALKATLYLQGLMPLYERLPLTPNSQDELDSLQRALDEMRKTAPKYFNLL